MFAAHYRLLAAFAASLSLILLGCSSTPPPDRAGSPSSTASAPQAAAKTQTAAAGEMDTDATIWTLLGFAKKPSEHEPGPQTGSTVSPILWQAAHETLDFVKFSSEDPLTGLLVSDWYSPKNKPDERYKVNVFILSRTLRSDSLAVTVDRQVRTATGEWAATTIARKVEDDLETAILLRAGQLKRTWLKEWQG
jgi:Domain of unknown function (DUF3576)